MALERFVDLQLDRERRIRQWSVARVVLAGTRIHHRPRPTSSSCHRVRTSSSNRAESQRSSSGSAKMQRGTLIECTQVRAPPWLLCAAARERNSPSLSQRASTSRRSIASPIRTTSSSPSAPRLLPAASTRTSGSSPRFLSAQPLFVPSATRTATIATWPSATTAPCCTAMAPPHVQVMLDCSTSKPSTRKSSQSCSSSLCIVVPLNSNHSFINSIDGSMD